MNAVFQALSDPTRREILRVLRERDFTAGELAERFPLAKSTLSGHFAVLKHAGLILPEKNGTSIVYSLNVSVFEQTLASIWEIFGGAAPVVDSAKPPALGAAPPHPLQTRQRSPPIPAIAQGQDHENQLAD